MSKQAFTGEIQEPEGVWCDKRRRFIPTAMAGTNPPSPAEGPSCVERARHEERVLADFDIQVAKARAKFQKDARGILDPSLRERSR
jgi:hypothetical protein